MPVNEVVYASDLIEEAQTLAKTKAYNSFSFRELLGLLNNIYQYTYERLALVDDGFWSKTIQLTNVKTTLPPCVKNAIKVYTTMHPDGWDRIPYHPAGNRTMRDGLTFKVSGMDIFVRDAERRPVFCEYIPEPPLLYFTKNNRDPEMLDDYVAPNTLPQRQAYGRMCDLVHENGRWVLESLNMGVLEPVDITEFIEMPGYTLVTCISDCPYVFVSYVDDLRGEYVSYVLKDLLGSMSRSRYNPFDYQGRSSKVRFYEAKYNDYTGMGVVIKDQEDGRFKRLGWTCDTIVTYPQAIMRHYIVARLAQRLADRNSTDVMEVERAVVDTERSLGQFIKRNQASFDRIQNVVGIHVSDYL